MSRPRYSPVVEPVLKPKRKFLPLVAPDSTSESGTEEESHVDSCEKLREAGLHHPICLPQAMQAVAGHLKLQLGKSPAVEGLGDILEMRTSSDDLYSSSSQEFNMTLPTKMSDMLTSTMLDGRKKQKLNLEDISIIQTRESLDPRLSGQTVNKEGEIFPDDKVSQSRNLVTAESRDVSADSDLFRSPSSTSDQNCQKKTQSCRSLELSNLHRSESGESGIVPREIVSLKERVEESSSEEENLDFPQKYTDTAETASAPLPYIMSPLTTVIPDTDSESDPDLPFVCQYPPAPHPGGVRITIADYQTLNKGTFLNDVIIDFYLNYLSSKKMSAQLDGKVFIFSSYFFKRLSTDPEEGSMMATMERDSKLPMAQKRHRRVLNWTKSIKLSQQNLVIFPICKDSHWFLVTAVMTRDKSFLVVMDSLGGVNRDVVDMINEYLAIELNLEEGDTNLEGVKQMEVVQPCLPQQDNYTDCGLYLLHYVEKMLERPQDILSLEDDLSSWFPRSEVAGKRSSLALLIRQLAEDQAASGEVPSFPDLLGHEEEQKQSNGDLIFDVTEKSEDADDIFNIIRAELSNLSPPINMRETKVKHRMSSSSSNSSVGVAGVEPCAPSGRGSKRFRMAEKKKQPVISIFSKAEYYRGKPSSERKFDQFLEMEMKVDKGDVFSQELEEEDIGERRVDVFSQEE